MHSHGQQGARARKVSRAEGETQQRVPDYSQVVVQHGPRQPMYRPPPASYYGAPAGPYLLEGQAVDTHPYMLPYSPYQQPGHMSPVQYHSPPPHMQGLVLPGHFGTYQPHMPPLKRPRTESRHTSNCGSVAGRRNVDVTQKGTPTRTRASHKTFSDFRIRRLTIGSFVSEESKEDLQARDSKIRFCFRNQCDRDAPSTLSATEAALQTPDRVSISLCKGTRRIVVPAHHIKTVEFRRNIGQIKIMTDGWAAYETSAVDMEDTLAAGSPEPHVKLAAIRWSLTESDITGGQMAVAKQIIIELDLQRPLTEPKWTRGNLEDHIDPSSRFLHIMTIVDAEPKVTFDSFCDGWAGDDPGKASFYENNLDQHRLLNILVSLTSLNNVLTPAISSLLTGMLALLEKSDSTPDKLDDLLKSSLVLIPPHMLSKSLDSLYSTFKHSEDELWDGQQQQLESSYGGSKRQRGESEVPSDQLAKASLDEKRRRLSDSEPQLPAVCTPVVAVDDEVVVVRDPEANPGTKHSQSAAMQVSKSEGTNTSISKGRTLYIVRRKSEGSRGTADAGSRMSREGLLADLEARDGNETSSDRENDPDEVPVEAATFESELPVDEWPALGPVKLT